jgi:hypothetical protein
MRGRPYRLMSVLSGFAGLVLPLGHPAAAQTPAAAQPIEAPTTPAAYGTLDYTITTIPGVSFVPGSNGLVYNTSGSLARSVSAAGGHFYSALDIPAGAIIDYIGFNNLNDGTANVMAVHLWLRDIMGNVTPLFALDNTPHTSWGTDLNPVPLGLLWAGNRTLGHTLILDMEIAPSSSMQYFASVEVWWKRSVSPAPGAATFNDVPTSYIYFRAIEALAASGITSGCGNGNFCPNQAVTRGELAKFLANALGLHWPE